MVDRDHLLDYVNPLLGVFDIKDYCPNGLQVEGTTEVKSIVSAVTASQAAIDQAIAHHADVLLVHHGYFWKGEDSCLTGMKKQRIQSLLRHNINLMAYHLPLDLHPTYGNNRQLGERLGLLPTAGVSVDGINNLLQLGRLEQALTGEAFKQQLYQVFGRIPVHIAGSDRQIEKVAWCTGAAQRYTYLAAQQGADAYITGEASEQVFHIAKETGIHFYGAGHHATERYGVQALGQHLAKKFSLHHQYIDVDNPI